MTKEVTCKKHPASFPKKILDVVDQILAQLAFALIWVPARILDPFVGIGGIGGLNWDGEIYGVEIEPEWAEQARARGIITHTGDARRLPWPDGFFGAICTSPTYGNRLADSYAPDLSDPKHGKRRSYRIYLGRPLTSGNSGAMHVGDDYRNLHRSVWADCVRVLAPGGLFLLNIKDHSRNGELQGVPDWHVKTLEGLGLVLLERKEVPLRGDQNTATMRKLGVAVVDYELVIVFQKPSLDVSSDASDESDDLLF